MLATVLLVATAALSTGCAEYGTSFTTGSTTSTSGALPIGPANADPTARPGQVASISARAQRCGFVFDAAKLKASYISYEAQPGATPAVVASIEKNYDAAFNAIMAAGGGNPNACSLSDKEEIQAYLRRYTAGYFAPTVRPIALSASGADAPFDASTFWKNQTNSSKGQR